MKKINNLLKISNCRQMKNNTKMFNMNFKKIIVVILMIIIEIKFKLFNKN